MILYLFISFCEEQASLFQIVTILFLLPSPPTAVKAWVFDGTGTQTRTYARTDGHAHSAAESCLRFVQTD